MRVLFLVAGIYATNGRSSCAMTLKLPPLEQIRTQVASELAQDLGTGDISSELLHSRSASASIVALEPALVCGTAWVTEALLQCDHEATIDWLLQDGYRAQPGQPWCQINANNRAILSAERTALNFLQTLSGVATATAELVELVRGTGVKLLDTRKTIPGLRLAQKYAVTVGGGFNHRMGLDDEYLLKENHILQSDGIAAAIKAARTARPTIRLVVEVENLTELGEALEAEPDRILLDNFSIANILRAVTLACGRVSLEVSGGVNPKNLRSLALTGVDYISVGGLTKHLRAVDLSLRML